MGGTVQGEDRAGCGGDRPGSGPRPKAASRLQPMSQVRPPPVPMTFYWQAPTPLHSRVVSGGFHTTTAELKAVTDCVAPYREVCRPLTKNKALSHVRPQVANSSTK